jgi:hypothetical protein
VSSPVRAKPWARRVSALRRLCVALARWLDLLLGYA